MRQSLLTGAGAAAGAALTLAATARADSHVYYVGTLADNGTVATDCTDDTNTDCTLRQAIADANANSHEYDYVVFKAGLSGAVHVGTGQGEIQITDEVYVGSPPTSGIAVISGDHQSRIFSLETTHGYNDVTISRLKLIDGSTNGDGGAIRNEDAALYLVDSRITGSHAGGDGGAIYDAGTDQIDYGGRNQVAYTTLYGNSADGNGGGIAAARSFGGIYLSTLAGNSASNGGAVAEESAASFYFSGISSSTISGNSATGSGGGVHAKGRISVIGTIVANDFGGSAADVYNAGYLRADSSLFEVAPSAITTGNHNILGVDPHLGPLQDNGGATPTLRPAADSPVVDRGWLSGNYSDQRGFYRPIDNPFVANVPGYFGTDIGSVELTLAEGPGPPNANPVPGPPAPPQTPVTRRKRCKKHRKNSARIAARKCKKKHRPVPIRPGAVRARELRDALPFRLDRSR